MATSQVKKASSELTFFREKQETLDVISQLVCGPSISDTENFYSDRIAKILIILDKYQEQSQLLGPHIVDLINPINEGLIDYLEGNDKNTKKFNALCHIVQIICKVRGQKNVAKHLPHEVHYFEPCLRLIHQQDKNDYDTWQTRYVLLLWMSTLCLTPFDIYSIDSSSIVLPSYLQGLSLFCEQNSITLDLITIVIETAKVFLPDFGPTREAAGVCLAAMLTRPDADMNYLNQFLGYSIRQFQIYQNVRTDSLPAAPGSNPSVLLPSEMLSLSTPQQMNCLYLGILFVLNQVFKKGHREKLLRLLSTIQELFTLLIEVTDLATQTLERKFLSKLLQRIGMTLLTPIEATWRYQKGYRSMNLTRHPNQQSTLSTAIATVTELTQTTVMDSEHIDIPQEIEEIMDKLLTFLSDKDTIVRWSAAKGIGRLTMRLNKSFGLDILQAILQQFEDKFNENIWHGGCLALAELSRRGLLLPEHLSEVVPIILEALTFDLQKGQYFVGANIRDAACYVCWAFARAYSPQVMRPYMKELSLGLITVALFDREINCRRAASAAFQENVGRQGHENFQFGIDIITIADFFAVSNRVRSYLDLSIEIARLDLSYYFLPLVMYLKDHKINHWDLEIRELAAKAIAKLFLLVFQSPNMILIGQGKEEQNRIEEANQFLGSLLDDCLCDHLYTRHGSLLASTQLLMVLVLHGEDNTIDSPVFVLSSDNHQKIEQLIPTLEKKRLYRGKGGEWIRNAVCQFLEGLARLRFQFQAPNKVLPLLMDSLNDHLKQPQEMIQKAARDALRQFLFTYFAERRIIPLVPFPNDKILTVTVHKYIDVLKSGNESNVAIVRGYIMALGVLPDRFTLLPLAASDSKGSSSNPSEQTSNTSPVPSHSQIKTEQGPVMARSSVFEDDSDDELPVVPSKPIVNPPPTVVNEKSGSKSSMTTSAPSTVSVPVVDKRNYENYFEMILEILEDYSNNTKLINGEYDAETCQYAIEAAVELTERLIASYLFKESYLLRTFQLLMKGCQDYSIDKRGDTGSWVRSSALKGLERFLAAVYGNLSLVQSIKGTIASTPTVGSLLQTSYGIGVITALGNLTNNTSFRPSHKLLVSFPNPCLGFHHSLAESWMSINGKIGTITSTNALSHSLWINAENQVITNLSQYDLIDRNLQQYLPFFKSPLSPDTLTTPLLFITQTLVKQLSEKLDSVRNIAGTMLERLLFHRFGLQTMKETSISLTLEFPDEKLLIQAIQQRINRLLEKDQPIGIVSDAEVVTIEETSQVEQMNGGEEKNNEEATRDQLIEKENGNSDYEDQDHENPLDTTTNATSSLSVINWHRPDHVYPIVVEYLSSPHYFHAVFSGLVLSVGGLTEAIVKYSHQALHQYYQSLPQQSSLRQYFHNSLIDSFDQLFESYRHNDRIILPLLKTLQFCLKQHFLSPSQFDTKMNAFYTRLILTYLFQELKQTTQIPKFFLIIDIYLLLLTMIQNSCLNDEKGEKEKEEVVVFGYEMPRRKILFYLLQLLSHRFPRVRKYTAEMLYVYFLSTSPEQIDRNLTPTVYQEVIDLLLATPWDANTLNNTEKKTMIQEQRNHILTLLGFEITAASTNKTDGGAPSGKGKNHSKRQKEKKDELDSYDALVREAGY